MARFRVDSLRLRLTAYYVGALAAAMIVVGLLIYALLARALYARVDESLLGLLEVAATSLDNDLDEGQDSVDAARSTAAELSSRQQMLAIFNESGTLLAEGGRDDDLAVVLPPREVVPVDSALLSTTSETGDVDDRHRLAFRRLAIRPGRVEYIAVSGTSLERIDEDLLALRDSLFIAGPLALLLVGAGGWFLANRSMAPVAAMAARARQIGAEDLSARLPVVNPADELGHLAGAFNDLLARLETSLEQQRQFMADASHELRTPVTTTRTAATVTLQQPHRPEPEYREALEIIEQQATRLSRIVDDMFTLARADAGTYPVRRDEVDLEEVLTAVVRAARVVAASRGVAIELRVSAHGILSGDEELIRRLAGNLIDNAIRYAPQESVVHVDLARDPDGHSLVVSDSGPGIPVDSQPHVFERFYRADVSRSRGTAGGAGLGLALARWIARAHGGDVELVRSSATGTTFRAMLPDSTTTAAPSTFGPPGPG